MSVALSLYVPLTPQTGRIETKLTWETINCWQLKRSVDGAKLMAEHSGPRHGGKLKQEGRDLLSVTVSVQATILAVILLYLYPSQAQITK
jgi:hypothetical protein